MDNEKKIPACDICGAPATSFARDAYRKANWETGWYEYEPGEFVHAGCDKHPPESRITDVTTLPPVR